MSFANPLGLIGLLSLPVILVLHLLRERQRRYVVSNLALWSFLDRTARGARPRRIPLTWLLVVDLLVAALLALAWAQPRLALPFTARQARHVVILLDVSSSMRAQEGPYSRFGLARAAAAERLNDLGPRDVVTVLAFGSRPQWVGDSRQDSTEQLSARVAGLQAGETGHALLETLALGQAALDSALPAEFHVLTDGAFPELAATSLEGFPHSIQWRLFGRPVDNQAILALEVTPLAEDQFQVFARVANFGSRTAGRELTLWVDGEEAGRARLNLPADASVPQVWQVSGSPNVVSVALSGSDSLPEDDSAVVGVQPGGQIRVALVAEQAAPVQQALEGLPGVDLTILTPQEYEGLNNPPEFELTIFRGYLPPAWPDGHVTLVEPPAGNYAVGLAVSGRREIPGNTPLQIAHPAPLLAGVDFGGVRWSRAWQLARIPDDFTLLVQAGNVPILLDGQAEATRLTVLLADLSGGNFAQHPAFPILISNLVQNVRQAPLPASLYTGERIPLPATGEFRELRVNAPGGEASRFGRNWPAAWENTLEPGAYHFRFAGPGGASFEYVSGVNAGQESESDLRPRAWARAAERSPGTGRPAAGQPAPALPAQAERQEARSLDLMPWLLALAALLLLLEAKLAWR